MDKLFKEDMDLETLKYVLTSMSLFSDTTTLSQGYNWLRELIIELEDDNKNKNIEDFLNENNFELNTYYDTNKLYIKKIKELEYIYVRIYSDTNKIVDVEYIRKKEYNYESTNIVKLSNVNTLYKLKLLLKSIL